MSNQDLLQVFREVLDELQEKQATNSECVEKCQSVVNDLNAELSELKEEESCAVYEDSEVSKKLKALQSYMNNITERPTPLAEKLTSLQSIQNQTAQKKKEASDSVQEKERELSEAKTRLAVKKKKDEELRSQSKDISNRIAKIQNDVLLQ